MTDDSGRRQAEGGDTEMSLEDLLREAAARIDPVPESVATYATEVFGLGALEQELAELTDDSWLDAAELTRGGASRMLTFGPTAGTGARIEADVTRTGRTVEVTGQVTPSMAGELRVIYRGGETSCAVDVFGRFTAEIPVVGSIKLWYRPGPAAAEAPIVTQWVAIG
jgi:hypothetical protein